MDSAGKGQKRLNEFEKRLKMIGERVSNVEEVIISKEDEKFDKKQENPIDSVFSFNPNIKKIRNKK